MGTDQTFSLGYNKALVTGGGGFVGKAIVKELRAQKIETVAVGRNKYPSVEKLGAQSLVGDICDYHFMKQASSGVDVIFHTAALAGIWGPWKEYYKTNVVGTETVIRVCLENNISSLIYTSTPSVVFKREDICGGDESLPYSDNCLCNYAKSKVIAEKLVLEANSETLNCCALRPHLIWGPGDPHLIPKLIQLVKNGHLKRVGDGQNLVDITYIDNVAYGHILAAKNLLVSKSCSGQSYFISQGQPVNLWQWINDLLRKLGLPCVTQSVSFKKAYIVGALLEVLHNTLIRNKEPKMTRFVAEQMAKSHYFSIKKAQTDLGYQPKVSTEQGLNHTIAWLK